MKTTRLNLLNQASMLAAGIMLCVDMASAAKPTNVLIGTSKPAVVYRYTAETVRPAIRRGAVTAIGMTWQCQLSQCTISGGWIGPTVSACSALALQVGPIKSYGRSGAVLSTAQLRQCNAAVTASLSSQSKQPVGAPVELKNSSVQTALPNNNKLPAAPGSILTKPAKPNSATDVINSSGAIPAGRGGKASPALTGKNPSKSGKHPGATPLRRIPEDNKPIEHGFAGTAGTNTVTGTRPGTSLPGKRPGGVASNTTSDPFVRDSRGNPVITRTTGGFAGGTDNKGSGSNPFVRDSFGNPVVSSVGGVGVDAEPKFDAEKGVFVFSDGTRVRGVDTSGYVGKVNDKGDIVYSDGTIVSHDNASGSTSIIRPDGSSRVFGGDSGGGDSPFFDSKTDNFVFSDGTVVRGRDPSGAVGKIGDKGEIEFSDGTRVIHDSATGRTEIQHPNGATTIYDGRGGVVHAAPGTQTSQTDDGGIQIYDPRTGVTLTSGTGDSTYQPSGNKDDKETGESNNGTGGSGNDDETASSGTSSSSSDNSDDDKQSSDDDKDKDKNDDNSSSSSEDNKDDKSEKEPEDNKGDEGEKLVGEAGAGTTGGIRDVVQKWVDRKTGMTRERDKPGDCGKKGGGMPGSVTQPGRGQEGGDCNKTKQDRPDTSSSTVDASVIFTPRHRGGNPGHGVVDPFFAESDTQIGGHRYNPFDRSPVVNPGGGHQ